jgi:hypothetical protein
MHPRLLTRTSQPIVNTVIAALLLLLTAPTISPAVESRSAPIVIAPNDSAVASELAGQLPLDVTFDDRMGTAAFAQLHTSLSVGAAAHQSSYRAGDVGYVASEQALVVFLADGSATPAGGLILVGHVTSGLEELAGCIRNCPVRIEALLR